VLLLELVVFLELELLSFRVARGKRRIGYCAYYCVYAISSSVDISDEASVSVGPS